MFVTAEDLDLTVPVCLHLRASLQKTCISQYLWVFIKDYHRRPEPHSIHLLGIFFDSYASFVA